MTKPLVPMTLCLLMGLALLMNSSEAQVAPTNDAMSGNGMGESAKRALRAIEQADYAAFHRLLDAAAQGRVALAQERFLDLLDSGGVTDEQAVKLAENHDPGGKLGVSAAADLRNLTEAQFFGLMSGILAADAQRRPEHRILRWHMVTRNVGLVEPSRRLGGGRVMPWGGVVGFENRAEETFVLLLTLEEGEWKVADYKLQADGVSLDFGELTGVDWDRDRFTWTSRERAMMAEGEQLMGTARNHCRVEYSKTASEKEAKETFEKEGLEKYDGQYFRVVKVHIGLKSDYDAAIEVRPQGDAKAYGLMLFKWASGESRIEWFTTQAELDQHLEELRADKSLPEPPPVPDND